MNIYEIVAISATCGGTYIAAAHALDHIYRRKTENLKNSSLHRDRYFVIANALVKSKTIPEELLDFIYHVTEEVSKPNLANLLLVERPTEEVPVLDSLSKVQKQKVYDMVQAAVNASIHRNYFQNKFKGISALSQQELARRVYLAKMP